MDPQRWWPRSTRPSKDGDTLGGVVEVVAHGLPPGLGSYVHWDRRLDARLAGALMGIQAIKGVEIGDGFRTARRRGSAAHDEMERGADGVIRRRTGRAGGTEGGMSIGEPLRVRAAMKPISTVPRALDDGRHRDRRGRRAPSTSAPTSVPSPRPGSSPRRWSRSCWPRRAWRSSAATR